MIRIDSATERRRLGEGSGRQHEAHRRYLPRSLRRSPKTHGERLAAEGEICWGGMHSWRRMVELLELVDRPETLGFQADMAHTLLYTLGYNAPEDRLLPEGFRLERPRRARRGAEDGDATRCAPGPSISMLRRTMRP